MTSAQRAAGIKYPYSVKDGILTMSDTERDLHVPLRMTEELEALSEVDFEKRVLAPMAAALESAR